MALWFQLSGLVALVLVPLAIALIRRGALTAPLWTSAVIYTLLGAVVLLDTQVLHTRSLSVSQGHLFHDTYYVIAHAYWYLSLAILTAGLAAILWAQGKWLSHPVAWLTKALNWMFHIGLLASITANSWLAIVGVPRRYVDYEAAIAPVRLAQTVSGGLSFLALAGLATLLIIALVRWILGKTPGAAGGRL